MRTQKIMLSAAVTLSTFVISIGLLEFSNYLYLAVPPLKQNISSVEFGNIGTYQATETKMEMPENPKEKYVHKEFSVPGEDGYYYVIGTPELENKPKGFKDFDYFEINTYRIDEKTAKPVSIKPNGYVYASKPFDFEQLKLDDQKISFTTKAQNGIYYQLDGKLVDEKIVVEDSDGEAYTDTVAIKGLLTKWKNGVKIAEAKVKLGFTIGC